jgi:hypothetical protein
MRRGGAVGSPTCSDRDGFDGGLEEGKVQHQGEQSLCEKCGIVQRTRGLIMFSTFKCGDRSW